MDLEAMKKRLAFLLSKAENGETLTPEQEAEQEQLETDIEEAEAADENAGDENADENAGEGAAADAAAKAVYVPASQISAIVKSVVREVVSDMRIKPARKALPIFGKNVQTMHKVSKKQYDLADYVNAIYRKDVGLLNEIMQKATMNVTTNAEGGYTVPTELLGEVLKIVDDYGITRQLVTRRNMTSNKMDMPTKSGGVSWYKVSENSAGTESSVGFGTKQLDATDYLMAIARSSQQLLKDSAVNIQAYLTEEFGYGLSQFIDAEVLAGDGTNFTGVLNESGVNVITMDSGDTAITDFNTDYASEMIDALTSGERRNGAFFFNKAIGGVLRTLKDANGNPIYQMPTASDPATLFGYPIYFVEDDVLPAAPAVNTKYGIFGSLKNVTMGIREDETDLQISDVAVVGGESTWERNQVAYKMLMRADIKVAFPGAFSVIRTSAS